MILSEISKTDTPIIIELIRKRLDKLESVLIDVIFPSNAGPEIGPSWHCTGSIFLVHDARAIGGDDTEYSGDWNFVEIEFSDAKINRLDPLSNPCQVVAVWADWAEEHLKLTKLSREWLVHI